MTPNQKLIAACCARLVVQIATQFGEEAAEVQKEVINQLSAAQEQAGSEKATPVQMVDTSFDLAKAVAQELNNPKVVELIEGLDETFDDAVEKKFFELAGDLIKNFKDIKALAKKG